MSAGIGRPGFGPADRVPAPLAGLRVLDFTRVLAGPWCTMILGDLGADIVKVENPDGGDDTRQWGVLLPSGERTYYLSANRNKRSIAIDLRSPDGRALARELAACADVVVENFKRGFVEAAGLDYPTLAAGNPSLVYCSVSGYGRTGPCAERLGYDFLIQGESGLMDATGEPGAGALKCGMPVADLTAGNVAAQAILAALVARLRTGRGQYVDIALYESMLANMGPVSSTALLLERAPERYGNAHSDIVPYQPFGTADGEIIVAAPTDAQFQRLCRKVLARPDLAEDPRFATSNGRRDHRGGLIPSLQAAFRERTTAAWSAELTAAQIPNGVVRDVLSALRAVEAEGREVVVDVAHPTLGAVPQVRSPLRLAGTPPVAPSPPPRLGEHTDAIIREWLGRNAADVHLLRERGVVA